jgi:Protein of unknown function (DUF2408)
LRFVPPVVICSLSVASNFACAESVLGRLQDNLSVLSAELVPVHERLVTVRRKLVALAAKGSSPKAELKPLQDELRKIDSLSITPILLQRFKIYSRSIFAWVDVFLSIVFTLSKRVDGKFLGPSGNIPASQAICSSLLEECFEVVQEIRAQEESKHVAPPLKPIHDRLTGIRAELEGLALTHRWTLRETDLWNYSLSLQEVDKMRIDGKFVDSEGNRPEGQYVRLKPTDRCCSIIDLLSQLTGSPLPPSTLLWCHLSFAVLE